MFNLNLPDTISIIFIILNNLRSNKSLFIFFPLIMHMFKLTFKEFIHWSESCSAIEKIKLFVMFLKFIQILCFIQVLAGFKFCVKFIWGMVINRVYIKSRNLGSILAFLHIGIKWVRFAIAFGLWWSFLILSIDILKNDFA